MLTPVHALYECVEDMLPSKEDFLPFAGLPIMSECTQELQHIKAADVEKSLGRPFATATLTLRTLQELRENGQGEECCR